MEKRDLDIITNSAVNWRMYQDCTVLITGATGRIGRYILETLADVDIRYNLNMRILGLARSEEKAKAVFDNLLEFPNIDFLYQDVNKEIEYDGKIDYIYHTAGPAAPKDYDRPVETLWAHVNGTHNVMECARAHETKRVFYVSTVETFGEWKSDEHIKESDMGIMRHLNSRACYPEAKRLCETMLATYKQEYGVSYCGVRLSHTLGPGVSLTDGRGFAEFMDCVLKNEDIVLHSDGSAVRTYTYVADAVNAMFLIMDKGEDVLYNVANEENLISIRDLAEMLVTLLPDRTCKVRFTSEASKLQYLPFKLAVLDTSRIRDLGWRPVTDLKTMFTWTMESFL
ncbi:MAG: NAD(P)-dependent oxidoreductase [Lachnospiraceae bacterium]|nr:NAD(P)-dependent oxidoreductase [Lachnospiraceae bacterium]